MANNFFNFWIVCTFYYTSCIKGHNSSDNMIIVSTLIVWSDLTIWHLCMLTPFNYSQTCIKRSLLGQGKRGLLRKVKFIWIFFMTEEGEGDLLIQVNA